MYHRRQGDEEDTAVSRIVDSDGAQVTDLWRAGTLDALMAEERLLGLMLADEEFPAKIRANITEMVVARLGTNPAILQRSLHQEIYRAILNIAGQGLAPDTLTVDGEMRRRNIPDYTLNDLMALARGVMMLPDLVLRPREAIEGLCQTILDAAGRRYMMQLAQKMAEHIAAGTPIADVQARAVKAMEKAPRATIGADTTIAAAAENYRSHLDEWRAHPGILRGTTTGLNNLDKTTHGWRPGQLIVLAARMSMGKSAYALSFTLAAARAIMERTDGGHDHQVGFISLEMDCDSLMHRLVAAAAGVDGDAMLEGDPSLDWDAIDDAVNTLSIMPIRIVDAHGANNRVNGQGGKMTVDAIREHALAWHREGRLDLLMIDFLGCIAPTHETRRDTYERQIAAIVQALKNLAAELQVPVILLVQLNRENEKAGNPVPQLHHLRDSDAIGQFADVVIFPVRWDYYPERGMSVPDAIKGRPKGYTELYVQKQRMGKVKALRAYSDMASNRVWEWSEQRGGPVNTDGKLLWNWKPEYWPVDETTNGTDKKGR